MRRKGINLGCGGDICIPTKDWDWVNTDIVDLPGVTVAHDLERRPWPWADGEFDRILAQDVFEHIAASATIGFMTECWRILRSRGEMSLRVPHWQHENAWTDPTHTRACTEHTFDYWVVGTDLYTRHNAAYGGVAFTMVGPPQILGHDLAFHLEKAS